jgi:hypothetical protein
VFVSVPRDDLAELVERAACAAVSNSSYIYIDWRGEGPFGKYHRGFWSQAMAYRLGAARLLREIADRLDAEVAGEQVVFCAEEVIRACSHRVTDDHRKGVDLGDEPDDEDAG